MNIKDYGYNGETNVEECMVARVITTHRDRYEIVSDKGSGYAQLKRGCYYDNPEAIYPTTGDFVLVEWNDSGDSMIKKTLKRSSSFSRANPTIDSVHEQLVAANFDYVFIMQSLNNNFNLHRIERYLALAWQSGAIPVIVLTKCDLVDNCEEYIDKVKSVAIGVDVYAVSCFTKEGLSNLNRYFDKGKTLVFLGSSGVGKSTLVNTLVGEEVMKTNAIREEDSRGRHTTTSRHLIMLPSGAMVIDTPGMRELGMWEASSGIDKTFQDVEEFLGKCKFSNCTHTNEPGCRVLEAIENGELSYDRYNSYLKLKNETRYSDDPDAYLKEKREKFKKIAKDNRVNKK